MSWPENPYLAAYLRSPEGQAYLEKYGCLDAWKRRHLLDMPIVEDPTMPSDTFKLVSAFSTVTVTNVGMPEAWDF